MWLASSHGVPVSLVLFTCLFFLRPPRPAPGQATPKKEAVRFHAHCFSNGFMVKADEESEGTVHVETNGSNEFFRVQTFAKELNGQRLWNS